MKRYPKWGSFRRLVKEAWTETDLALERQDRIDREIEKERIGSRPQKQTVAKGRQKAQGADTVNH